VHVAVVVPCVGCDRRLIGLEAGNHFFVGPDNGIFWPVIEVHGPAKVIQLKEDRFFLPHITQTFHGRDVFAPVAAHLSMGEDLEQMGPTVDDPIELKYPVPDKINEIIYGQVMHIDNFGNLITNIHLKDLEDFLESQKPVITVGSLEIIELDTIYSDADEGEPLALINSSNLLEIAVNLGRASEYIGVESCEIIGTVVKVGRYE